MIPNSRNFYDEFKQKTQQKILGQLIKAIQNCEQKIFQTKQWKKENWKIKGFLKKTIKTEFGTIQIKRRLYFKNQEIDGQIHKVFKFWLDEAIGLGRYNRFFDNDINRILQSVYQGVNYRQASNFFCTKIANWTIKNLILKKTKEQQPTNQKIDVQNWKCMYFEIDDTYAFFKNQLNQNIKYQMRLIVIHSGYHSKNFKKLNNCQNIILLKSVKSKINSEEFQNLTNQTIVTFLKKNYQNYQKIKKIVNGDGAKWIKKVANKLEANFVLDQFHLVRNINLAMKYNQKTTVSNCDDDNMPNQQIKKSDFIKFLQKSVFQLLHFKFCKNKFAKPYQFLQNVWKKFWKKRLENESKQQILWQKFFSTSWLTRYKKLFYYLKNQSSGIQNLFYNKLSIGCRTEALIGNLLKRKIIGKIFSLETYISCFYTQNNFKVLVCDTKT